MNKIHEVYKIVERAYLNMEEPSVTKISKLSGQDPYRVLVSCLISLRTKDEVTLEASERLFHVADNPYDMVKLSLSEIEKLIYPAGFYRNKAKTIVDISSQLIDKYEGKVPDSIDELLKFKGVGRKTANLVVVEGYGEPAVCVDVHVHRIMNRTGLVKTKNPDQTEMEIREYCPKEYWIKINEMLVAYGRSICKPVSPFCSRCEMADICEKNGVEKSR